MFVYVQDIEGRPLMPTQRHGWVRRALKNNKAVVVEKYPFTIRLTYNSNRYTQPVTLGVDTGSVHVGLSATTIKDELFTEEVILRQDIVGLISARKELRRTRRNKLRYRKARFLNRTKSKGWLAPSICQKINSHIKSISDICSILPISKIIIEVAQFDTQKIKNSSISGIKYQEGEQLGFWNIREYVLARDGHKCRYCNRGIKQDVVLNVHHIESRKTGGDSPGNLITLCKECHKAYHEGKIMLKIKRSISLRDAAVMNIMRYRLYDRLKVLYPNTYMTFGYITKHDRIHNGIKKSHISDAFVISKNFSANRLKYFYKLMLTRRHNRQIHKAKILKGNIKKNNQAPFEVRGFRLFDRVIYNKNIMFVTARRIRGQFVIRDINYKNRIELSYKNLKLDRCKRHIINLLYNDDM